MIEFLKKEIENLKKEIENLNYKLEQQIYIRFMEKIFFIT